MINSTGNSILVSIIIPVFNVERYVEDCLNSVIAQDYAKLECVIVNDDTQDSSMTVVDRILGSYCGPISFKVINKTFNEVLSSARNTGIINSNGQYVFFIDSDDYLIRSDAISTFVAAALQFPEAEIITGRYCGVNESDNYAESSMLMLESNCDYQHSLLFMHFMGTAWNRLIKKDFIIHNGLYFDKGYIYEDHIWNIRTLPYVTLHVVIPSTTYYYRMNPDGIMKSTIHSKSFKSRAKIASMVSPLLNENRSSCYIFYYAYQLLSLSCLLALPRVEIDESDIKQYKKLRGILVKYLSFSNWMISFDSVLLYSPFQSLLINKIIRDKAFSLLLRYRDRH
ncbi:MAG: glycosyltransferase family 2 protein [Bacteroidaceae bacterium]|nr:glycosyltransferase family 2 protein [Bacteroidaceae bacterium]